MSNTKLFVNSLGPFQITYAKYTDSTESQIVVELERGSLKTRGYFSPEILRPIYGLLPENLVIGIATGGCPHTAIREDPSINISVIEEIEQNHPELDLIIIESGGDNIMTTFSPSLADYFIYIVDVAGGDKYPRKGGLGIESCDLLVINKTDLAHHVGADLNVMEQDAIRIRKDKPHVFVNCKNNIGIDKVSEHIIRDLLFDNPPKITLSNGKR